VTVEILQGDVDVFGSEALTWQSGGRAPVRATLQSPNGRPTEISFHEVWWADLDEPATFWNQVKFWIWGLSIWSVPARRSSQGQMVGPNMTQPSFPQNDVFTRIATRHSPVTAPFDRLRLLVVSSLVALGSVSIMAVNFFAKRLGFSNVPGSDILIAYLGDVRLYVESNASARSLDNLGQWPRTAIRRRMIRALADMAMAGYDRWYVLAHSLGSIVAFNGLMEPHYSLANFLDRARWERACAAGLAGRLPGAAAAQIPQSADMSPRRPHWLGPRDGVYRGKLFAGLRGLLTYGSPLDKFAAIWPKVVPLNSKDPAVFPRDFEWVNVYDPTDPIAGYLDAFDPRSPTPGTAKPENVGYRASPWLLFSHLRYLDRRKGDCGTLVRHVAEWLLDPKMKFVPTIVGPKWIPPAAIAYGRLAWALAQWAIAAVVLAGLPALVLSYKPTSDDHASNDGGILANRVLTWLGSAIEVIANSLVAIASAQFWRYWVWCLILAVASSLAVGTLRRMFVRR
jgi:hypothetical protein